MQYAPVRRRPRWLWFVLLPVLILLFGWFVWPTPYAYTKDGEDLYRVNRFSGVKEISGGDGWQRVMTAEESEEWNRKHLAPFKDQ